MDVLTKQFGLISGQYSTLKTINDSNITRWLLDEGETDLASYRRNYVVGGDIRLIEPNATETLAYEYFPDIPSMFTQLLSNVTIINGLYNSITLHSRPLAVNLMSNTLLQYFDDASLDRTISSTNHPLPSTNTVSVSYNVSFNLFSSTCPFRKTTTK